LAGGRYSGEALEAGSMVPPRERVINAAARCIADVGFDKTTTRMVADRVGFTTGMVLYYFPHKAELMEAVLHTAIENLSAHFQSFTQHGIERLEAGISVILTEESIETYLVVLSQYRNAAQTDSSLRQGYERIFLESRKELITSVSAGQADGDLRRDIDSLLMADLIYALIQAIGTEKSLLPGHFTGSRSRELASLMLRLLSATKLEELPRSAKTAQPPEKQAPIAC
jgi:AcrR family transcriptional regulator